MTCTYGELNQEANANMEILPLAHNKISQEITEITAELAQIVANMKARLERSFAQKDGEAYGYALAHCQVEEDRPLRIFVAREGKLSGTVFINPEILWGEGDYVAGESCLSFPTMPAVMVKRYKKIGYRHFDLYGQEHTGELWDVQAQIFQHEVDHLNGINIYAWDKDKFVKIAEETLAKEA